jgi:hypothetical protein
MIRATAAHTHPIGTAGSWTGRAVTSSATDSGVPRLVSSGTFRTRVSQMRVAAPCTGARTSERRNRVAEPAARNGRSAGG